MRILYHYPLCPYSRKVRFLLAEKRLDFSVELERFWDKREDFLELNPLGTVPVLVDLNGSVIVDSVAITEYLEEAYPQTSFLGKDLKHKAEVRRLCSWFDHSFARDVSVCILMEKHLKLFLQKGASPLGPNSHTLRTALQQSIEEYAGYLMWIIEQRNWLAGEEFSLADITAAAHLSVVDYFGDMSWDKYPLMKEWYMRVKSRPTFRPFLSDRVAGVIPSAHYANLDF